MVKKIYAIVIGIFVLASIWVGVHFITKNNTDIRSQTISKEESPDSTQTATTSDVIDMSGWSTYRSEKYGYTIKYPSEAEISVEPFEGDVRRGDVQVPVSEEELSINLNKHLQIPDGIESERQKGYHGGIYFSILIDNSHPTYSTPCGWYYGQFAESDTDTTNYDSICRKGGTVLKNMTGKPIVFNGESAYLFEYNYTELQEELYTKKDYTIVFFHNDRPWEIRYVGLPSNPTPKWKSHPYYKYLEQSVPITEAIIKSFRFTD